MNDQSVLSFWFDEITPAQRWVKDAAFDRLIEDRFSAVHKQANQGELFDWRQSAQGRWPKLLC